MCIRDRLNAALAGVDGDGTFGAAGGVGQAYRAYALASRSYYAVVFARPIPGLDRSPEAFEVSLQPLRPLTDAVAECAAAGVFRPVDPAHAARVLWAASQGAVSLEPAGYGGAIDPAACYEDLVAAAAASFFASGVPATRRGSVATTSRRSRSSAP